MKNFIASLFAVLVPVVCTALGLSDPSAAVSWANYVVDVPPGAVYTLRQSPSGMAWVGTNRGLYTFDGFNAYAVDDTTGYPFAAQVYAIIEEDDGGVWLGTNNGLFRYNPADRLVHGVEGDFPNEIRAMLRDDAGRLWIGSLNGLYVYEPSGGRLRDMTSALPHRAVYALLDCEADGCVYVGTYDGLCRYDFRREAFEEIRLRGLHGGDGNVFVNALAEDMAENEILVGTEGALLTFRPGSGAVGRIAALDGNSVKALAVYGNRRLAAGTDNGLYILAHGSVRACCRHDSRRAASISDNVIWSLLFDAQGNLWAGTGAGLSIAGADSAVREISLSDLTGSGDGQTVYSIFRDSRERLWLGGSNGIIQAPACLTPDADASQVRWHEASSESHPIAHNRVRAIAETSDGCVWVAGDGGLNLFDERTGRFRRLRVSDRTHTHNANWAYALAEDSSEHKLWVGGYLGGAFRLDMDLLERGDGPCVSDTVLTAEDGALANNLISNMVRDRDGGLWVLLFRDGTLVRLDPSDGYKSLKVDVVKATGGWPTLICADADGGVRVACDGGTVVRVDKDGRTGRPVVFGRRHDPSGILYAMAPVGRELWVAAGDGVRAIDRAGGEVRLLPLPPRTYSSIYFDELTRTVLLGTTDGIVQVDPRRIAARKHPRSVNIVRLTAGGRDADPASASVKLPADNGVLAVELATFDFTPNNFERFAYRIPPDSTWTLLPHGENEIVLSGLPAGRHVLEMRLGDDNSTAASLEVEMLPPWYLYTGFKLLWAALLVAAGFAIFYVARRRNIANLRRVERRNALAKAEERLNFLTNISHDLKTPLSMIIAPLSRVSTGTHSASETGEAVATAYRNALRLNRLLSHTLESSRLDAATDSAALTKATDISALVRGIFENCASAYPGCVFEFHAPDEAVIADVDAVKFESVVSNLLSNAIKYSPAGEARITGTLAVDAAAGSFRLTIADRGIGIMPDQLPRIFDRMYRTPRGSDISEGTGIGLYLVKHFVELHGGRVSVESTVGEGSAFTVEMPLRAAGVIEPSRKVRRHPAPDPKRPRVLVIDDSDDILGFIGSLLEPEYQCAFASDGREGLELASTFRPDLIITDEKMPGMTGLELARHLKSTPATASISIILLTAMGSNELESRSVREGIDLFMTKPFDPAMLRAQVARILRRKAEIRRGARIEELTAAGPVEAESESERMLAKVTEVVERNIDSPRLSVAFVCEQTGLQPKQLYRLMKKYVNLTPVEYIRKVRLDKAAALLEKGALNVSEVMYRVGFNSPSYFSKCFVAQFGVRPAEYKKRQE